MGLLDDINSGLGNAMASPLFNMGAGLLSARYTPYGNVGSGLMQGQQAYQQARASQLQNQMQQLQLSQFIAQQPALMQALKQWMGGDQSAAPQPQGQAPLNPPEQTFPLGSAPGAGTAQGQAPQQASAPQAPQAQPPQGLLSSQAPDPFALLQQGSHEAQFPMPGTIGDMIRKSGEAKIDQAKTLLGNLPQYVTQRALAGDQVTQDQALLDAAKRSGDPERIAQATAKLQRDTYGGVPQVRVQGPGSSLGAVYTEDPNTHVIKQDVAPAETAQFITPEGVRLLPKAEGMRKGYQPFNPTLLGANNMTDGAKEFAYQWFVQHGSLPANFARNPLMVSSMMDYISNRAKEEGNTAASITANNQATKAAGSVVKDFTSGQTSKTINGINTAVKHVQVLMAAIDELNNGNVRLSNRVGNAISTAFGRSAPNNFEGVRDFVAGEIAKAAIPGGGGEAERQALASRASAANSPTQLKDIVTKWTQLLAGKTDALRNTWDVGTRGTQGDFDRFLLPDTKKALGIGQPTAATSAHPSDIQALLDKYKAY